MSQEHRKPKPAGVKPAKREKRKQRTTIKERGLAVLRSGGGMGAAADAMGIDPGTLWRWRHGDPEFQRQVDEACDASLPLLEDILQACARQAPVDPRYQVSLFFLLVNRAPDRWQHRHSVRHEHRGVNLSFPDIPNAPGPAGVVKLMQDHAANLSHA